MNIQTFTWMRDSKKIYSDELDHEHVDICEFND